MNVISNPRVVEASDRDALLATIDRWLDREVKPVVKEHDHADRWPAKIVAQMQELGLFGATIGMAYGGLGLPATTYAEIVMRISAVWMAITGIFNSHLMLALAIEKFGTEPQRRRWLPPLANSEVRGGLALTEPDAGTDLQGVRMTARREGSDYVINGTKTWISNGIEGSCFALHARRTGRGCDVDTCLFDVAMHQLTYAALWYLNEGYTAQRLPRSAHLALVPVQTFPTSDGWVFIMCMTEKFWRIFCDAVGRPDLPHDDRFATAESRRENREMLSSLLDNELSKQTTEHWLTRLTGKIPIAPVYDIARALDAPFTRRTGMVRSIAHPARAELCVLANPLKLDGVRPHQRACASLGADNAQLVPPERATP